MIFSNYFWGYATIWHTLSFIIAGMEAQAYHARRPKSSPLWQCLDAHFDTFLDIYPEAYEHDYGFLRPIIPEVAGKFMRCGDFAKGFARVRCDHCAHESIWAGAR